MVRGRKKHLVWIAAVVVLAVVGIAAGVANSSGDAAKNPIAGIVPPIDKVPQDGRGAAKCQGPNVGAKCSPLIYNGGPVMKTVTDYVIYWAPAGYTPDFGSSYSANYQTVVSQFFTDIAADSGKVSNVYGVTTQFCDGIKAKSKDCSKALNGSQFVTTTHTFGASVVDTTPLPSNGCIDPSIVNATHCLTDTQLHDEIDTVAAAHSWVRDASHMIYLYTPQGLQTCYDDAGQFCAYVYYCAYHSEYDSGSGPTIYANMPYPKFAGHDVCEDTNNIQHPNDADADEVLSTTSHEGNEAISDPFPNSGWWDPKDKVTGGENGDKCAYYYGGTGDIGGTSPNKYNQTINGHHYYVQLEWSNADTNCLTNYGPRISAIKPTTAAVGKKVSVSGARLSSPTSVTIDGTACDNPVITKGVKLVCTVNAATPAGTWPLIVTTAGGSASSPPITITP
jgi:hypothetical protein